jgi:hypothetical protein
LGGFLKDKILTKLCKLSEQTSYTLKKIKPDRDFIKQHNQRFKG